MPDYIPFEIARKIFIDSSITKENLQDQYLEIQYGIRLIEKERSRFDRRGNNSLNTRTWLLENEELGWGVHNTYSTICNKHRWDITTDGSLACFRMTFVDYVFYDIEHLTKEEQDQIIKQRELAEIESNKRNIVRDILSDVLINNMFPFGKLSSGELEIKYGIHLHQIQRGMHMNMRHTPQSGRIGWVANVVLGWGSSTGWDITLDGKIACCRVNYDDYINFEIQILSDEQIQEYKNQFASPDNSLVNRLATLKQMLDQNLISTEEFTEKKIELLASV